jgi:signal-transduction protein with cAMP-binding, CBS, and nucleotidyltransferase domain
MFPTVEDLTSKKIYSIQPRKSVLEAAEEMALKEIGSLLVKYDESYIGIITEVDIIRKVVAKRRDPATLFVETVMTSPLITIEADRSVVEANDVMEQQKIRHLGVTKNGVVIGLVSVRDFLHPLNLKQAGGF